MKGKWKKKILPSALVLLLSVAMVSQTALPAFARGGVRPHGMRKSTTEAQTTTASGVSEAEETVEAVSTEEQTYIPEDGLLADNDELTEGYLASVLGLSDEAATVGNYGEDELTGLNKTIYDLLKTKVAEVAAATSSTSTSFSFSAADLGLTTEIYYTAEELGLNSLGTVTDGTATLADGVGSALLEKLGTTYELKKIMKLLCVNCPYELYWYDKKTGTATSASCKYGISYDSSTGEITKVAITSYTLTIKLAVASDYQDSTSEPPTYTVSGSTSSTVQTAKLTAESIVSENASGNNYTKLLAYKDTICELVSYNDEAASDSYDGGYGDPWQLIYVFDGDENTEVVCEGYSKAFQYLCDLSTFTADDVICYTVTGTLDGGTGSGAHMWNIVTMDNGKNYLVDVTNSDDETVGSDGELFLAGTDGSISDGYTFTIGSSNNVGFTYDTDTTALYGTDDDSILNLASSDYTYVAHAHSLTKTEAKDATCTEAGNSEYWTCSGCGKLFSDEAGTTETTLDAVTIAATGHTLTQHEAVEATADQNGNIEYWSCDSCGKYFSDSVGTTEVENIELIRVTIKSESYPVTVNGTEYSEETTIGVSFGDEVTIEADTSDETFEYWLDGNNVMVSSEASYTFQVYSSMKLTATYKTQEENKSIVKWVSAYGQIMQRGQYSATDEFTAPDCPTKIGYTGSWSMTVEEIKAEISEGKTEIVVEPVYVIEDNSYTIIVTDGSGSGTYTENTVVTVKANDPEDGMKFSHWEDSEGNVLSYETTYKFYAIQDYTVKAVYVTDETDVEKLGTAEITKVVKNTTSEKISFVAMLTVPDDCTIQKAGVFATKDETIGESGDGFNLTTATLVGGKTTTATKYQYTFTKGNVGSDTWYARPYVIYKDADGNTKTVIGTMVSASLD